MRNSIYHFVRCSRFELHFHRIVAYKKNVANKCNEFGWYVYACYTIECVKRRDTHSIDLSHRTNLINRPSSRIEKLPLYSVESTSVGGKKCWIEAHFVRDLVHRLFMASRDERVSPRRNFYRTRAAVIWRTRAAPARKSSLSRLCTRHPSVQLVMTKRFW